MVFFPRYENVSIFDELSLAAAGLAKNNMDLSDQIQDLRQEKEDLGARSLPKVTRTELVLLERQTGIKPIEGRGVKIILDDSIPSNIEQSVLCQGANIRDVVNILKLPQLEVQGISINGVRLHLQSSINCFADGIALNTTRLFPPYEIHAIGDTEKIINTLKTKTLAPQLWSQIEQDEIEMNLIREDELILPAVTTTPTTRYFVTQADEQ